LLIRQKEEKAICSPPSSRGERGGATPSTGSATFLLPISQKGEGKKMSFHLSKIEKQIVNLSFYSEKKGGKGGESRENLGGRGGKEGNPFLF